MVEPPGGADASLELPFNEEVYRELRARAGRILRRRRHHDDPASWSLVHSAIGQYLDAYRAGRAARLEGESDLLIFLTRCLRNQLTSHVRRRLADRRRPEGGRVDWPFAESFPATRRPIEETLMVDEALLELERAHPRRAQVVALMFFGGCSQEEVAGALGVTIDAVRWDWTKARAWLHARLRDGWEPS